MCHKGKKRCFPARQTIQVGSSYILTVFECEMCRCLDVSSNQRRFGTRWQFYLFNRKVTRSIKLSFNHTGNSRDNRKFVNGVKLLLLVLKRAEQEMKDESWKSEPLLVFVNRAWTLQRRAKPHHNWRQRKTCFLSSSVLVLIHSCSLIGSTVSLLSSTHSHWTTHSVNKWPRPPHPSWMNLPDTTEGDMNH